ncbi:MAG: hypothetical protein ACJAZQ_002025 [Cognaticolwellia sp.]
MKLKVWDKNTLDSPSVMKNRAEYNIWCARNGCIATAIIVSNSVQQNIIEKIVGNIKTLNCKGKAFVWLRDNYDI